MAVQIAQHRFTATEYDRMIESGVLAEDARVELIDGAIVEMTPIGKRHAGCVDQLTEILVLYKAPNTSTRVQNPLLMSNRAELQPDLMLLRRRLDFYRQGLPTPADVLLLIEVLDSSAEYDHSIKLPLYAQAMIPEIWLVNLSQEMVEIYTQPMNGTYQQVHLFKRGDELTSPTLPGLVLHPEMILG